MKTRTGLCAALVALAMTANAMAQSSDSPAEQDPGYDFRHGSVYVRCDGFPAHHSGAEIAARVLLIMATAGLAGPGERADTSKRLTGADAVAACDAAIAGETDPTRKIQLTLARAVHHIEAKQFDAALADATSAPGLAGAGASDIGFQHSLMLSSLELQAAALARLNRPAEAEAAALNMAAASPYDLIAQERATRYVGLTATLSPAKSAYLDRYARMTPMGLFMHAYASEWAGDYAASAADFDAFLDIENGFATAATPAVPLPEVQARLAVALAMSGDFKRADAEAAKTQKIIDDMTQNGKALSAQAAIGNAGELIDFEAIVVELGSGKTAQARAAFTGRSRWVIASPAAIADLTARLRKGAKPADLTGPLQHDPAEIRASALQTKLASITNATDDDKALYAAIRPPMTPHDYAYWNDDIRKTASSPFFPPKTGKETYTGDLVLMRRPNGIATGDALLMHCALVAKSEGKAGFVLYPVRNRLDTAFVRFGNPGEPGIPARAMLDAATVASGLSGEFPEPAAGK
ncbi:MAG: hypothetical protein ABSD74_04260 [Rhizomicrobium sp.]|jgi:hypothetical protein